MPVPTTELRGLDIVASIGATVIAGGRGATLSLSAEGIDTSSRDSANWAASLPGARTWTASAQGLFLAGSAISGAGLEVTAGAEPVAGVRSVEIGFTSGTAQTANTTSGYDARFIATRRTHTLSIETDAYDDAAAAGSGYEELFVAWRTGVTLAMTIELGASLPEITGTYRVTSIERAGEYEGFGTVTFSLEAVAAPTFTTTSANASQLSIWTAFNTAGGAAEQNVRFGPPTAASAVFSGMTYYTGQAIPTAFNISIPFTGEATLSAEWQGTGALTSAAVASI